MKDHKEEIFTLFGKAERALDSGDANRAVNEATKAHRLIKRLPAEERGVLELEALVLVADSLIEAGRSREALPLYEQMRALDPEDSEVDALEAVARFHLWQFEEALRLLDHHDALGAPTGLSLYYRSLALEFLDRQGESEAALTAAIARDPDAFSTPIRLGSDEVERLLRDVIASLPDDVREALATVSVSVSPLPDRHLHAEGLDPLTLGVYIGSDLATRSHFDADVNLDRIEIFQRNVERVAGNREEAKHELRVTLLHEIGHHLGWDEDDLEQRGLA